MPKDDYLAITPPQTASSRLTQKRRFQHISPLRMLGTGTFSSVYLSQDDETGEELAVKIMDLRRFDDEYNQEVSIMMYLTHQGIDVGYQGTEIDEESDTGYIYMKYIPFPTLSEYLEQACCGLKEHQAFVIFQNLVKVIEDIHSRRVAHKDLKPENIFVKPGDEVTVIDYGLSTFIQDTELDSTFTGSPLYMPPEVLNQESYDPTLADSWSLGVILYEMLIGSNPWSAAETMEDLLEIVSQIDFPTFLSNRAINLLSGMLAYNPKERDTIRKVREKINTILTELQ